MKDKLLASMIFVSFLFITGAAKAEIPEWHKPTPCFGCHGLTLGADYGPGECGDCHYYFLDINKLQTEHNPKICRACHIGKTALDATDRDLFHGGHNSVQCKQCHTVDNSTVIKIEGIESKGYPCVSCHGDQIHGIHMKNLDKICSTCHGSWAAGKVYKTGKNLSQDNVQDNVKFGQFTIFGLLKSLLNALLGIR